MKITASRRDDILKRKAEYEADLASRQAKYSKESKNLQLAVDNLLNSVRGEVLSALGNVTIGIKVDVRIESIDELHLTIRSDERTVRAKDKALVWSWSVHLDESGQVQREFTSWTPLQAVTRQQLDSLKETLRVLEILHDLDWATLLSNAKSAFPKYSDYITSRNPYCEPTPDWESELKVAEIEDAIKTGTLLKGEGYKYYKGACWYKIIGENSRQYNVIEISDAHTSSDVELQQMLQVTAPYRLSKTKFIQLLYYPIKTMEV